VEVMSCEMIFSSGCGKKRVRWNEVVGLDDVSTLKRPKIMYNRQFEKRQIEQNRAAYLWGILRQNGYQSLHWELEMRARASGAVKAAKIEYGPNSMEVSKAISKQISHFVRMDKGALFHWAISTNNIEALSHLIGWLTEGDRARRLLDDNCGLLRLFFMTQALYDKLEKHYMASS